MKQSKRKEPSARQLKKGKIMESVDHQLFIKLKAVRRMIADERQIPAYIVFSDATLVDMCKKCPTTPWKMLEVSGVGRVKLEMYGDRFLQVLRSFYHSSEVGK